MFQTWKANFAFLRQAANTIGAEFEAMTYEALHRPAEELSGERDFAGVRVIYSAEMYNRLENGDIAFCVDVTADLPTFLGVKPSYQFKKRADGSVYY